MGLRRHLLAAVCVAASCAAVAQSASAAPPIIESQWVTGVSSWNATLNAQINPNGLLTKYKLQIDTTGNFSFFQTDSCPLHPSGIGCAQAIVPGEPQPTGLVQPPEMTLLGSTVGQPVKINLGSIGAVLQPETTYHFRAIAANGTGFAYGPDLMFTTPAPGAPSFSEPEPPKEEESPEEEEGEPRPPSETGGPPQHSSLSLWSAPVSTFAQGPTSQKRKHRKKGRLRINAAIHQAQPVG